MNITILGSGTITSPADRNPAGYLIEYNGHLALVDCGPGILKTLNTLKIDVCSLDAIFLSHFHQDHCSDVMALLMRCYLLDSASQSIILYGPDGLSEWFETQASLQGSWLIDFNPSIIQLKNQPEIWQGIKIRTQKTLHTKNSIAYKFENGNKCFFYSGDTGYSDALADFSAGADIAVIECSYSDEMEQQNHLTPEKAARFINRAQIKQTVLTHIYPENDTADLLQRVQKFTSLPVQIGYDLLKLEL